MLARPLAEEAWQRVSLVTAPGEFSVRGDIVDLFAPGVAAPARLEYFGDELETVRVFDPDTQRATATIERLTFAARSRDDEGFAKLIDHFEPSDLVFQVAPDTPLEGHPGADLDALRGGGVELDVRQVEPVAAGAEKLRERIREACEGAQAAFFA